MLDQDRLFRTESKPPRTMKVLQSVINLQLFFCSRQFADRSQQIKAWQAQNKD